MLLSIGLSVILPRASSNWMTSERAASMLALCSNRLLMLSSNEGNKLLQRKRKGFNYNLTRFIENCTQGFGGKFELKCCLFVFGSFDVVLKWGKLIAAMEEKGFKLIFDKIFWKLLARFWREIWIEMLTLCFWLFVPTGFWCCPQTSETNYCNGKESIFNYNLTRFFENCTQGFGGKFKLKCWLFVAFDVVFKRGKQIAAMEKKGFN